MIPNSEIVTIKILEREYQIKCPAEKVVNLQEAARYLDIKMQETYQGNKTLHTDNVMIAVLNIINELMTLKRQKEVCIDFMSNRISELHEKIKQTLAE